MDKSHCLQQILLEKIKNKLTTTRSVALEQRK